MIVLSTSLDYKNLMHNKLYILKISTVISFVCIGFELPEIEDAKVGDFGYTIFVLRYACCGSTLIESWKVHTCLNI